MLLVGSNDQDLRSKLIHYCAKDHTAHSVDCNSTNVCDLRCTSIMSNGSPYDVCDDDSQVENDMHGDLALVGYLFGL